MLSAEGVPSDLVHTFGSDAPKKIGDFGIPDVGALVWLSGCIASASPELLIPMNALRIRGLHNAMNALAATALTLAVGIPLDSILRTLREYKGEPHRVQLILRPPTSITSMIPKAPMSALLPLPWPDSVRRKSF